MATTNLARSTEYDQEGWLPPEVSGGVLTTREWQRVRVVPPVPQRQVVTANDLAPWVEPVVNRLVALSALPADWDTYGAPPISSRAVIDMWTVLQTIMRPNTPPPFIAPTAKGYLQAEWHQNSVDLEIVVLSATEIQVGFEDQRMGIELDKSVTYDFRDIADAVGRLTA